jgi:site-specific DNA recombinase
MAKQKKIKSEDKKTVALYCRVSTYEQGKGDYSSLHSQEDALRKYCESKGWQVYDLYSDTKSGISLEREGIQRLLRDAAEKKFNVVASIKLDRLSRSVRDFLSLDEQLRKLDVDIVITTQNIDTTTPAGKMQRTIMLAFGEFERDMIAERTREKLYYQAEKGFWKGGTVPLGYDTNNKKLEINEKESILVKNIFDRYIIEPSTAKVAEWLNKQGYRTKVRVSRGGRKTGGKVFNKKHIYSILRNKIYIGNVTFNGEVFIGLHSPIITDELFNKVQKRLDLSREDRMVLPREDSPLTLLNILKCGVCGSAMTTGWSRKKGGSKKYYYYKCTHATHNSKEHCDSRDLKARELELFVEKLVSHIAADDDFFNAMYGQLSDNAGDDLQKEEDELASLKTNHARIERELKNLISRLSDDERLGGLKSITDKIVEIEEEKASLGTKIEEKLKYLERIRNRKIGKRELKRVFNEFNTIYGGLAVAEKRRMNQLFFSEIKSYLKRGSDDGVIEVYIRSDGNIKRTWTEIVIQTDPGSTFRPMWLHRQDSNLQPIG